MNDPFQIPEYQPHPFWMDSRGVLRGFCQKCSCQEYKPRDVKKETAQSCARCGHPPAAHHKKPEQEYSKGDKYSSKH